jgi:hypothetical protein
MRKSGPFSQYNRSIAFRSEPAGGTLLTLFGAGESIFLTALAILSGSTEPNDLGWSWKK